MNSHRISKSFMANAMFGSRHHIRAVVCRHTSVPHISIDIASCISPGPIRRNGIQWHRILIGPSSRKSYDGFFHGSGATG